MNNGVAEDVEPLLAGLEWTVEPAPTGADRSRTVAVIVVIVALLTALSTALAIEFATARPAGSTWVGSAESAQVAGFSRSGLEPTLTAGPSPTDGPPSAAPTRSGSPSPTSSATVSGSPSPTGSPTSTGSPSPTGSPTASRSAAVTASATAIASATRASVPPVTRSPSAAPSSSRPVELPGAVACAQENGSCVLPQGAVATVWYGVDVRWVSRTGVVDAISCSNSAFPDPAVGARKSCRYTVTGATTVASVPPSGAIRCASENATCVLPFGRSATVWFGAGNRWVSRSGVRGSIPCTAAAFGSDPAAGTGRSCVYRLG